MSTEQQLPQYHVLNFFHDDDDACALTALVHHIRYHIIVEPKYLTARSNAGKEIAQEYRRLLRNVKEKEEEEAEEVHEEESQPRETDNHSPYTQDSGVDVSHDRAETNPKSSPEDTHDPRTLLHKWILTPLIPTFTSHQPPPSSVRRERTVQKWYYCQTHFFHLELSSSSSTPSLTAKEDPASASLFSRMAKLLPSLHLPKYLRALEIPMLSAKDLVICSEAGDPDPVHPAVVREKGEGGATYFLKVVDPAQPGPTKREIRLMKEIEKKGIHEKIRMPLVRGLVYFDSDEEDEEGDEEAKGLLKAKKGSIMGFVMDPIEEPTPLTLMLDSEVEQERREKWAREAERMVGVLHENGIVWGDAKGDNFMVDKQDRLWIIDFGGSYTPGWIDPELKDTEEGDNQGLTRLVNGLMDPEEGTIGGEEEEGAVEDRQQDDDEKKNAGAKRKAKEAELDVGNSSQAKHRKSDDNDGSSTQSDDEEAPWICECGGPESGDMIACDGESCGIEWFHMSCVGLDEAPKGEWYCAGCRDDESSVGSPRVEVPQLSSTEVRSDAITTD